MKKTIISAIALFALLASCDLLEDPGINTSRESEKEKETKPQVEYYTLRLNGNAFDTGKGGGVNVGLLDSVAVPRALSNDNAQAFHDFFEVVFYYNGSNNAVGHRVARTTWNVGETPGISGVYGKAEGDPAVNYTAVGAPTSPPAGSALLFAGLKDDKTLLAVGKLSHIDNQPISGTNNTISSATVAVTFEVTALKAGVASSAGNSSFRLYTSESDARNRAGNGVTIRNDIYVHQKIFPFFQLRSSPPDNYGSYFFDIHAPHADGTNITNYAAGIVLAGGYNYEARNPRYLVTDGQYQYSSVLVQDFGMRAGGQLDIMGRDGIKLGEGAPPYNPETAPQYFQNPVVFKIDTSASLPLPHTGTVFALAFEIYVYNLTARPATLAGGSAAVKWRISPGTGTKWLDLDDGTGGAGGAVFLGTGDVFGYMDQSGNTPPPPSSTP